MRSILGIDVGLSNFGVCILGDNYEIHKWSLIDTGIRKGASKTTIVTTITGIMDVITKDVTHVVVENQGAGGRKMIVIETTIINYCVMKGIEVRSVHSTEKFKILFGIPCPTGKANRQKRKNASIDYVKKILKGEYLDYFLRFEKQDDLADALCMCMVELRH